MTELQDLHISDSDSNSLTDLFNELSTVQKTFRKSKKMDNIIEDIDFKSTINNNYYVKFLNYNDYYWLDKKNISDYTLEVFKICYNHNKKINNFNNLKNTIIYSRISNSSSDISLDTQKYYNLQYCLQNNLKLKNYSYDYGVSGRYNDKYNCFNNFKNGELEFVSTLLKPGDNLVFYTIDRVGRHSSSVMSFLEDCIMKNITIHFTKDNLIYDRNTPSHIKKIIHQGIIDAEHYSDITSEKIRKSIEMRKSEGHHFGKAPYGSKIIRNHTGVVGLTKNEDEQEILIKLYNLYKINQRTKYFCSKKKIRKIHTKTYNYKKTCNQLNYWINQNYIFTNEKIKKRNNFTPSRVKYLIDNQEKFIDMITK